MKDKRFANRGATFEEFLRFANDRYEHHKIAIINKQATEFIPIRDRAGKIVSCKVEHKATVDFLGRYGHFPIAMEAKNTNDGSIRFDAVQHHQAEYMDKFTEETGTIGLVLLSFELKRFFVVPWAFWSAAYDVRVRRNDRTASVTVSAFGETWTIPKKFSANIEDLNPSWEIPNHDYTYGLHYLQNAEKYIVGNQQP